MGAILGFILLVVIFDPSSVGKHLGKMKRAFDKEVGKNTHRCKHGFKNTDLCAECRH